MSEVSSLVSDWSCPSIVDYWDGDAVIIDVVARVQHITISGYTDGAAALRTTLTDSISEPIGRVQRSRLVTIVCRLQVGGRTALAL